MSEQGITHEPRRGTWLEPTMWIFVSEWEQLNKERDALRSQLEREAAENNVNMSKLVREAQALRTAAVKAMHMLVDTLRTKRLMAWQEQEVEKTIAVIDEALK